jgi:endoglucanase
VFTSAGIIWREMAALGRMDLATVPSQIQGRDEIVQSVIDGAAQYLEDQALNGFGQPYFPDNGIYVWGSNSQVLNNLVVLGTAYDLGGNETFRNGVLKGVDYLLGRNGLNLSYVTDYGSVFSQNQHSRWYSNQLDPSLPHPPSGSVAGGPNAERGTWDPTMQRLFGVYGCAPSMCYVDDIQSWSTNELTLNWNSALAWVASFVADQDTAESGSQGECEVRLKLNGRHHGKKKKKHGRCDGAEVVVTNTGDQTWHGYEISWSHFGDQRVKNVPGARFSQEGATVTVSPRGQGRKLRPGKSHKFTVKLDEGRLADAEPGTFFVDGAACVLR